MKKIIIFSLFIILSFSVYAIIDKITVSQDNNIPVNVNVSLDDINSQLVNVLNLSAIRNLIDNETQFRINNDTYLYDLIILVNSTGSTFSNITLVNLLSTENTSRINNDTFILSLARTGNTSIDIIDAINVSGSTWVWYTPFLNTTLVNLLSTENISRISNDTFLLDLINNQTMFRISNDSLFIKNNTDIIVSNFNATGNITFIDESGQTRNLGNMAVHTAEMQRNTLLDASKSTITTLDGNVTFTLYTKTGQKGQWNFNGTIYGGALAVSSASVQLLNGTDLLPVTNYIHFKLDAGVPTLVTTSSYPSYEHIDVGTFIIGSVVGNTSTIYGYDRNRYEIDTFVTRVLERYEESGTLYVSGFGTRSTTNNLNISYGEFFNNIFEMTTTNNVTQQSFYFINSSGHFILATSLANFTQYNDGVPFSGGANERINIIWGVVQINTTQGTGKTQVRLVAVLPNNPGAGNTYTSVSSAIQDNFGETSYFPPNAELKRVFTPIARTIFRPSNDLFEPFATGIYHRFIAGTVGTGGASPTPGTSNHASLDNLDFTTAGHTNFASTTNIAEVRTDILNNATYNYNLITNETNNRINNDTVILSLARTGNTSIDIIDAINVSGSTWVWFTPFVNTTLVNLFSTENTSRINNDTFILSLARTSNTTIDMINAINKTTSSWNWQSINTTNLTVSKTCFDTLCTHYITANSTHTIIR